MWLLKNICGYPKIYVATQKYMWLLKNICGYSKIDVAARKHIRLLKINIYKATQ